ncbi:hypothetical protein KUTeg_015015 [Tegillarca granosa]|uniref:Uncharacterized protein n=1 Tax=Tegillarca granosa TaxID=220873 RepID=A0ABQ9ERD2_TEGGR|nr:hypothetical protein KUTeg_015015 [Tegillarca granosa]
MSIGLLTSSIQALKKVSEQAQPYVQTLGDGITTLVKQGTEYAYIAKKKTRLQLVRISAAVCGIELCYAAETAFVSPILLKLGVPVSLMTLVWCASPLIGFFLVPFLGSLSDRCTLKFGRRRPFIVLLSVGIIIGLILVPNGETLGMVFGDRGPVAVFDNSSDIFNSTSVVDYINSTSYNTTMNISDIIQEIETDGYTIFSIRLPGNHIAGIILTIFGVALLDVSCDAAQSPCRAYLLDVISPEDHSAGLTSFTVMAGLGGSVGYLMGGIDWNNTGFGKAFGGHIRLVFTVVLIVFVFFVALTITSFKEVPLQDTGITNEMLQKGKKKKGKKKYKKFVNEESEEEVEEIKEQSSAPFSGYGTIENCMSHCLPQLPHIVL